MEKNNKVKLNIQGVLAFLTFTILLISITLYVSGHGFLSGYFSVMGSKIGLFDISIEQFLLFGGIGILKKTFYIYFGSAALFVLLITIAIVILKLRLYFNKPNLFSFQESNSINSEEVMGLKIVSFFMPIILITFLIALPFVFLGFVSGSSSASGKEQGFETIEKYNKYFSQQGNINIPVISGGKINPPIKGIQDICFADTCLVFQSGGISKTLKMETGVVVTSAVVEREK